MFLKWMFLSEIWDQKTESRLHHLFSTVFQSQKNLKTSSKVPENTRFFVSCHFYLIFSFLNIICIIQIFQNFKVSNHWLDRCSHRSLGDCTPCRHTRTLPPRSSEPGSSACSCHLAVKRSRDPDWKIQTARSANDPLFWCRNCRAKCSRWRFPWTERIPGRETKNVNCC